MDKKGFYKHKKVEDYIVCVYDITFCMEDNQIYYSYMDPQFGFEGGCRTTSKDKFLKHFVFMQLGRY